MSVEYLVVLDSSVYSLFQNDFGSNLDSTLLTNYIKIFYCQMVNSVNILFFHSNNTDILVYEYDFFVSGCSDFFLDAFKDLTFFFIRKRFYTISTRENVGKWFCFFYLIYECLN